MADLGGKAGVFTFYFCLGISILAVFAVSANSLLNLPSYWNKEEYSHGPLIAVISIFMGWHIVAGKETSSSWLGIPVLLLSLFMSVFAELSAFEALLNYSFIVAIPGISLLFLGKKSTVALLPAICFLIFAVPLPHIVYGNLSVNMQLVSSTLGTALIDLLGFSVFQDGNIIDLGHMKLQVEEACNGLRYMFPLLSLGFLAAYMMQDRAWKRIAVFLSAIPITVLMNAMRIALVGVTVNLWGQEMAEGVLHWFEGFVVFGVCLALLLVEMQLFLRVGKMGRFRDELFRIPKGNILCAPKLSVPIIVGTVLCLCGLAFSYSDVVRNRVENIPLTPDFRSSLVNIDGWSGTQDFLSPENLKILDLTDYWLADYQSPDVGAPVNFYIAWYDSQRMRANIHNPLNCIIGGGWRIEKQGRAQIKIVRDDIPVNRLVIRKDGETAIVYYWLEQRGRKIASPLKAKLFLVWDSIMLHRTDGALVRVSTPVKAGETPEDADARLRGFMQLAYPVAERVIPGRS